MARKPNATYPDSVQPGIPVLGPLPKGWVREPLGKRLHEIKRPIKMRDDCTYNLVTVKRSRGGAVKRESLHGKEIKVKSQFEVHSGDFLISKRQIVHGACALVPEELHGAIVSNEYSILGSKKDLDLIFLRYLSETKYFQETCFHSSIGVHVEKMVFKLDRWLKWEFNFPPIEEQKKIVKILSLWEDAIHCTRETISNRKYTKKLLMRSLLTGKMRIPGFNKEWAKTRVKDIAEIYGGLTGKAKHDFEIEEGNFFIPYTNVYNNRITDEHCLGKVNIKKNESQHKVCFGDILFTMSSETQNEVGMSSVCLINGVDIYLNSFCFGLRLKSLKAYSLHFISFLLRAEHVRSTIIKQGQGTIRYNLSARRLLEVVLQIPPLDEQKAIAQVLTAADALIAQYEAKLAHLQQQKKALMQQLLTGKIRVTPDTPDTSGNACETPA